jgi:hypothetical protein
MRTNWMVHLITNWMGDGAWLWKMSASVIKFNYVGDTHWMTGEIMAFDVSSSTVEIAVKGTNQRGEVTCVGSAVVILPTDSSRPARAPQYDPADVPAAKAP